MAKSMLKRENVPNKFWVVAIASAIYLSYLSPTKIIYITTPQEAWSRKIPNVSGSIAYVHVPKEMRTKMTKEKIIPLLAIALILRAIRFFFLPLKRLEVVETLVLRKKDHKIGMSLQDQNEESASFTCFKNPNMRTRKNVWSLEGK